MYGNHFSLRDLDMMTRAERDFVESCLIPVSGLGWSDADTEMMERAFGPESFWRWYGL